MEETKKRRRCGKPVTVKDIFFKYPDGSLVNIKDMTPERRQAEFDAMQDKAMVLSATSGRISWKPPKLPPRPLKAQR